MIVKKSATIVATTTATTLESLVATALSDASYRFDSKWDTVRLYVPTGQDGTVYFRRSTDDTQAVAAATTNDSAINAGGMIQLSGTSAEKWSILATKNTNVAVEVGIGNGVTTDFSDDNTITVDSITATVNSDIDKVGGTTVPTVGTTPAVPTVIYDDAGNQITAFGSPSTIAEYKSPSDFTATYTSATTITLSSLPVSIADSSQIVYIRVVPASGDAEVYVNGSGGVTMTVSSNVLTIAGAGTPFASGDVYEIGINAQKKAYDPSTQSNKESVLNPDYSRRTDAETVLRTPQNLTTSFANVGSVLDVTGYKKAFFKLSVNINTGTGIKVKGLGLSSSGDTNPGDLPIYNQDTTTAGSYKVNTEANIIAFNDEYFDTAGTPTDRTIWVGFDVDNTIPYIQLQMKCGATGATAPAIDEVILCKGY